MPGRAMPHAVASDTTKSTTRGPSPSNEQDACTTSASVAPQGIAVILLIDDLNIRIIAADAAELLT